MRPLSWKLNSFKKAKQSGQVVVEYVLLLTIGVAIAVLITNQLVKKGDPKGSGDDSGAIIVKWREIRKMIANDDPGKR